MNSHKTVRTHAQIQQLNKQIQIEIQLRIQIQIKIQLSSYA